MKRTDIYIYLSFSYHRYMRFHIIVISDFHIIVISDFHFIADTKLNFFIQFFPLNTVQIISTFFVFISSLYDRTHQFFSGFHIIVIRIVRNHQKNPTHCRTIRTAPNLPVYGSVWDFRRRRKIVCLPLNALSTPISDRNTTPRRFRGKWG